MDTEISPYMEGAAQQLSIGYDMSPLITPILIIIIAVFSFYYFSSLKSKRAKDSDSDDECDDKSYVEEQVEVLTTRQTRNMG